MQKTVSGAARLSQVRGWLPDLFELSPLEAAALSNYSLFNQRSAACKN